MYFIYAIHNKKHDRIYIGQTQKLSDRLMLHNSRKFDHCYTSRFDGNWEIIYKEQVRTRQEALKREKQLKSYRGRQFIRSLIKE